MEGNVQGHPLGFDNYHEFGPIKMVGGKVGVMKTKLPRLLRGVGGGTTMTIDDDDNI